MSCLWVRFALNTKKFCFLNTKVSGLPSVSAGFSGLIKHCKAFWPCQSRSLQRQLQVERGEKDGRLETHFKIQIHVFCVCLRLCKGTQEKIANAVFLSVVLIKPGAALDMTAHTHTHLHTLSSPSSIYFFHLSPRALICFFSLTHLVDKGNVIVSNNVPR